MDPTERFLKHWLWKRLGKLILFIQIGFLSNLFAAPLVLRCEIHEGNEVYVTDFMPDTDPYNTEAININYRFQFKAVVSGNEQDIEYVRIYTYYKQQHQVVLLHEVKYIPPFRQSEPAFAALTGVNYLYAPLMERELQYGARFWKFIHNFFFLKALQSSTAFTGSFCNSAALPRLRRITPTGGR